jgi:predicted amidohydrolase YtcJ
MHKALVIAALVGAAAVQVAPPSTIAIVNARVFTGVTSQPWAEAIVIRGDRIVSVGASPAIREAAGPAARVIDAGGRLVVPGFNDAHMHPGTYPEGVRLEGPPAMDEDPALKVILQRVSTAAARAPKGGWIFGEIGPAVVGDPAATRFALDAAAPDHKVMLTGWTGHGTLFNTSALRHLAVSDTEPDPPGGFFTRMPDRRTVSGMAHEYAEYRLRQRLAMEPSSAAQLSAINGYAREAAGFGITSVQAMLTSGTPAFMTPLLVRGDLPLRVRPIELPMSAISSWRPAAARAGSPGAPTPGVKWIIDGTPLERLAFMREAFADAPTRGRLNFDAKELTAALRRALDAGIQPMLHVAGDASIDVVLEALDASGGERWRALRPRLEHAELFGPEHYARAQRVGAVLVVNPSHFMLTVIPARLGAARAARFSTVQSALAAGIPLAIGSDGPMNPFLNIMFATLRPGNAKEALSREQAVSAYTRGSAFAELQESGKGTIAPGMLADVAMLSQDIFKVPAPALPGTVSVLTIVGGRIVHEQKGGRP